MPTERTDRECALAYVREKLLRLARFLNEHRDSQSDADLAEALRDLGERFERREIRLARRRRAAYNRELEKIVRRIARDREKAQRIFNKRFGSAPPIIPAGKD